MKLKQLSEVLAQAEREATITIYQPDNEPYRASDGSECTITFTSAESKAYRRAREIVQRRALRSKKANVEPDEILRNRVDLAAAPVVRWHGWEGDDDTAAPCTIENVRELLAVEHILTQLEQGINAHASFFTNNSPS
jgi:hypothetical protein